MTPFFPAASGVVGSTATTDCGLNDDEGSGTVRYYALACDYDGTLARHGQVDDKTHEALQRLRNSGRKLILVTGRELDDLLATFPHTELFDCLVVENGALLYWPATKETQVLGSSPPEPFVRMLRDRHVQPLSTGHVIVSTWEPHGQTVLEVIHTLGLELQVVFNKGAVMVLPSGVNKAVGLEEALHQLKLSRHNTVAVGDAENDHAFLRFCECSVAVANALDMVKTTADFVTTGDHGDGVTELIDLLLETDLSELEPSLRRHDIPLGHREDDVEDRMPPFGVNVMLAGTSGSGKSTFATGVLERLADQEYQFCIIDPEGDYQNLDIAVSLGTSKKPPTVEEVIAVLEKPEENVVINLVGVPLEDRPGAFDRFLAALLDLRIRTGRPHWLLIDEAHHVFPASRAPAAIMTAEVWHEIMLISVHPELVAPAVLTRIDTVIAIGREPLETLRSFSRMLGEPPPGGPPVRLETGEALIWQRRTQEEPFWIRSIPPRAERQRHVRKYAEGELLDDEQFVFRGPEGKLHLRAQNLFIFLQLAEGVDDETWLFHLRRGDYSRWFRDVIKDPELAAEAEAVEKDEHLLADESRRAIHDLVERRYTLPA